MSKINEYSFILPNENINEGEDLSKIINFSKKELKTRWNNAYGKKIIRKWRESQFNKDTIETLVGKYYNHIDLRGISLNYYIIKNQNLSSIDFFGASFNDTIFENVDFTDSWLSESNLKGAKFKWSTMDNVILDNVIFDIKTEFQGIALNKINFTLAALLRDLVTGQERINHLKSRNPILSKILWITSDYGRSLILWLFWTFFVIGSFTLFYWLVPNVINKSGFLNSLYFSFITFTTLGYGDIIPISNIAKIAVIFEVILGYLMGGLLVAILAKKVIGN